jgi:hypothetical protein
MMAAKRWLKGNTHTHTLYSDGDSMPEHVVNWYAEHDYDFLFLTDHNVLIPDAHLAKLQHRGLPVWQGEEITMSAVHVNGLGIQRTIVPPEPAKIIAEPYAIREASERLRWAIAEVRAQHGVPTVNHPNWLWRMTAADLLAAGETPLVEIANMASDKENANEGRPGHPSTEELWDMLLSQGRQVWGVASDDAHHFQKWGPEYHNPGRGWLQVEAEIGNLDSCLAALREGRFYASVGPELTDYRATADELDIALAGEAATVELVGAEGQLLDALDGTAVRFDLRRVRSPFVRARVIVNNRPALWTQPIFI